MIGGRVGHVADERLSAWLSGDLSLAAAAAVRAHVGGCQRCRTSAEALRTIVDVAASLPAPEPPLTLWARIETALDEPAAPSVIRPPPDPEQGPARRGGGRPPASPPPRRIVWASCTGALVGAAAALAVVLGGPDRADRRDGAEVARLADRPRSPAGAGVAAQPLAADVREIADPLLAEAEAEVNHAAAAYERAIDRLRGLLAREQDAWNPEERARTAERLARLDEAIVHSRAALSRDPGNGDRADVLFSAYRRKIDFLAEAVHRGAPAGGEALP